VALLAVLATKRRNLQLAVLLAALVTRNNLC
jgi:hypothetical protein